MIRLNIPGFFNSDGDGPRWGDAQIIDDGTNYEVIDGYCSVGTPRLIQHLKDRNIEKPFLYISHAHYDHDYGIRKIIADPYFSPRGLYCYDPESLKGGLGNHEIKEDYDYLKTVIAEARARKIPVTYLKNGDKIRHGEIEFYVYRRQPGYKGSGSDPHGWEFMNDGSLCFWFPELSYLTTGDAGLWCAERYKLPVKFFKGGHHDNDNSGDTMEPSEMCRWLKQRGCEYFWDNDFSTELTDFLMTGREDALNAKMKFFSIHGDINAIFFGKRAVIYKGGQIFRYECPYDGAPTITKEVGLDIVKKVLGGKYGSGDARITKLLNEGYNPGVVQREVNAVIKLVKG